MAYTLDEGLFILRLFGEKKNIDETPIADDWAVPTQVCLRRAKRYMIISEELGFMPDLIRLDDDGGVFLVYKDRPNPDFTGVRIKIRRNGLGEYFANQHNFKTLKDIVGKEYSLKSNLPGLPGEMWLRGDQFYICCIRCHKKTFARLSALAKEFAIWPTIRTKKAEIAAYKAAVEVFVRRGWRQVEGHNMCKECQVIVKREAEKELERIRIRQESKNTGENPEKSEKVRKIKPKIENNDIIRPKFGNDKPRDESKPKKIKRISLRHDGQ